MMLTSETNPLSCADCVAHRRSDWSVLGRHLLSSLDRKRETLVLRTNQTLFEQSEESEGTYCIESGHILLQQQDAFGNLTAFRLMGQGDSVGWRSLFADQPHAATATALTACRVCLIRKKILMPLLRDNSELAIQFLKTLAGDRGPADALLLRNPLVPAHLRLIHLLMLLYDQCATSPAPNSAVYQLPMKRMHLAAMIGVRRETLSRAIRQVEDDGLARFEHRRVTVPDYGALLETARQPQLQTPL